ncbi:MAG: hypothetical protein OXG52_00645 [bacterium]|nr:hypothetical protein [bacterium]
MALAQTTAKTTTLRISTDLRDEISRLAEHRGTTMVDVVTDAVHRLGREEWWLSVHGALDDLTGAETASYRAESRKLEAAAADGLDGR